MLDKFESQIKFYIYRKHLENADYVPQCNKYFIQYFIQSPQQNFQVKLLSS